MAQTRESKVKAEIKKVLDAYGAWYFMPAMNGFGRAGIPDFVCCLQGAFFAIEAKAVGGEPTAWQSREIEAINRAGGCAFVCTSGEQLAAILAQVADNAVLPRA